jgi:molybdenum cofactor cytidylyltransferase
MRCQAISVVPHSFQILVMNLANTVHSSMATNPKITAIVMAAGASSRMGEHKLLLKLNDETLIHRVVRQILEVQGFYDVLVVTGREPEKIQAVLEGLNVRFVQNDAYLEGIGTSFRAAISQLEPEIDAAMFALADQPFVSSDLYKKLLTTYLNAPNLEQPRIVAVQYAMPEETVIAPPHIFHQSFFATIGTQGHGAKPLIEKHKDQTTLLEFPQEALFDEPGDLEKARLMLETNKDNMNADLDDFINTFLNEALGHLEKKGAERQAFYDKFLSEDYDSSHDVFLSYDIFAFKSSVLIPPDEGRAIIFDNYENRKYLFLICKKINQVWKVSSLRSICLGCFGSGILVDSICPICFGFGWTKY